MQSNAVNRSLNNVMVKGKGFSGRSLAPEGQPFDQVGHFFGQKHNVFCPVIDVIYSDSADDQKAEYYCDPVGHDTPLSIACPF